MRRVDFSYDELCVLAMFDRMDRKTAVAGMEEVIPMLRGDDEMSALVIGTIEKVKCITDAEFEALEVVAFEAEDGDEE